MLFSLLYFLRQEGFEIADPDINQPIETLFDSELSESGFSMAVALFELHHAINIPDSFINPVASGN